MSKRYSIKIFVGGQPGYYEYETGTDKDQALEHFANIVRDGYRRINERKQLIHHMPRTIDKVVLVGPGLSTQYPDRVITT